MSACKREASPDAGPAVPKDETADQFIARVNREYKALYPEMTAAQWISSTYINDDSKLIAAKSNERFLTQLNRWLEQARRFEGRDMSPQTARAINLLKIGTAMPPPKDPEKLAELTRIATDMEGMYGAGTYCTKEGDGERCRQLGDLEDVLRNDRDYDDQLDAWPAGTTSPSRCATTTRASSNWSTRARATWATPMPANSGAPATTCRPTPVGPETDRLWNQVKPLYDQLHCYARTRLESKYPGEGSVNGMLPAHLMGNMWQQDWSNLWDLLEPYPNAGSLDITGALKKQYESDLNAMLVKQNVLLDTDGRVEVARAAQLDSAKKMAERAQDFYISLGMPKLPPLLGELPVHQAARPRRGLPRQRLGHEHGRRRAHQDVHQAQRGGLHHHLPRDSATSITTSPTTSSRRCSRPAPTTASTKPSATPSCWR